ncbi:MAG: hypothetical protein HUU19_04820 [Phycisphaerales bacterium]|nr:hypothetical protein [Phycisphaerales bacterium]
MSMRLGVRWVGALSGLLGAVVVARAQEQPATPPASVPSQTAPQPEAKPEAKPEPHPESDRPLIPSGPDDSDLGPDDEVRESVVILTDGRRMAGVLSEQTAKGVTLSIGGIDTFFPAENVASVESQPTTRERYRQMRETIDDDDVDRRANLADWLRERGQLRLALREVEGVLARNPSHREASELRTLILEQMRLDAASGKRVPDESKVGGAEASKRPAFPVLSPEQINLLRVYEIDLADPPRMVIEYETVHQLYQKYAGHELLPKSRESEDQLHRKRPEQILELMFRLRAREFYPKVQVIEDPGAMRRFRDNVHRTWIINSCATSACHGGNEAGRLMLNNRRPNSDATVYTNYLILDRFRIREAKGPELNPEANAEAAAARPAEPRLVPLIDYDDPARSPLLQLGLPAGESTYPHPIIPGPGKGRTIPPVFRGKDDRRYIAAIEWIKSMYKPRTEYPIEYTPPSPATPAAVGQPTQR